MDYIVVIPARYESTRLPGKPLIELCGVPMIIRTCKQCAKAVPLDRIYVATDDERIKQSCEAAGFNVVMTSTDCMTGTDRVAEVAKIISADTYINVQGDEPLFSPQDLTALIHYSGEHRTDIVNGYCVISSDALFRSASIPKIVMRPDGRLLYMSRSPIPVNKDHSLVIAHRQVCAYAFPKNALDGFMSVSKKTPLEAIEDIEILRFLELGWDIRMIEMSDQSIAVDNPSDVERVESAILERGIN